MIRLIKRYGSRKLYDTEESRYVSLEELSTWIREGQQIEVRDNQTDEDVTQQTLIQIIAEAGRRGDSALPQEFLHDLIRKGGGLVGKGVDSFQSGVGQLLTAGLEKVGPVKRIQEETRRLRERLEKLETAIEDYEQQSPQEEIKDV